MSQLDQITKATRKYIRMHIDKIFITDPMMAYLKESVEESDPFEDWVRETRAANGVVDPPREPSRGGG